MRFGIDARTVQDRYPGIGRYVHNLIRAMGPLLGEDTLTVFYDPAAPDTRHHLEDLRGAPGLEWTACPAPVRSWQEQVRLPGLVRRAGVRVLHAPYYVRPYLLPCPAVLTVYDVISHLYPAYLPSGGARLAFEAATHLSLRTARWVLVPSFATAVDLYQHYRLPLHRTAVIPLAAGPAFRPQPEERVASVLEALGVPRPYALYLGTNKPHKNLPRLVEAWARVMRDWPGTAGRPTLVLAGPEDLRYPQARQVARDLGLGPAVRWLGPVDEAVLPALYAGAEVFVFPSLYEGFGLPVLEAMACGAPVACADNPALRELVADAAARFAPLDVDHMASTLSRLLQDRETRAALGERGLARAAEFSWERTARATLAVYREAAR